MHLSLHSATKGIAGLNDATLGVIAGEQELIDAIWAYSVLHGSTPSPYDALNAIRGIRTLAVRTTHQAASALRIAEVLVEEPGVAAVHYPGLVSHPQFDLAKRQMRHGGTVLAIELAGGQPAAERFLDSLQLARIATSLGGPETLVCHPATSTHASLTPEEATLMGVSPGLLRISVGLEDTADLLSDLTNAASMTRVLCLHGLGGTGATMWPIVAACTTPTSPLGADPARSRHRPIGSRRCHLGRLDRHRPGMGGRRGGRPVDGSRPRPPTLRRTAMCGGGVHQPGGCDPDAMEGLEGGGAAVIRGRCRSVDCR